MCSGGLPVLTIMFLWWLPVWGGEFCSSVGTTSKSEEAPCARES